MAQLDIHIEETWITNRVINFLNRARSSEDIVNLGVQEGEENDYWIGRTVAQRMLDHRSELRGGQYASLNQLNDISGFGQDKFDELVGKFSVSAAQAFQNEMQSEILPSNFPIYFFNRSFPDQASFLEAVDQSDNFKKEVENEILKIVRDKFQDQRMAMLAAEYIQCCPLDIAGSETLASYEWANWFYKFDADNWFSYDRVRQPIRAYIEGFGNWEERRELRIFRRFPTGLALSEGITPKDLPIVVNYEEWNFTIWVAELFD
ncbi:MAG: hypothetical protein AAFU64_09785 [Bacteroidota bacterium]